MAWLCTAGKRYTPQVLGTCGFFVPDEFSLFGTKIVPNKLNSSGTIFIENILAGGYYYVKWWKMERNGIKCHEVV